MMRILRCSALLFALAVPEIAGAAQTYPAEINRHLGLGFTPPCTLCHASNDGGLGTVVTPFGKSMMAAGLTVNIDSLDPSLDRLNTNNVDSNADGVADIEQLRSGINPNDGTSLSSVEPQQYGCGARIAVRSQSIDSPLVLLGLVTIVVARRVRKIS